MQLLLGNIGRPGGGILALRGHASIQGSTDIPTLYNLLPGYLPMPQPANDDPRRTTSRRTVRRPGFWGHFPAYVISLLKAYWGDAATAENDFGFGWLPRITGDHSHYQTRPGHARGRGARVAASSARIPLSDPPTAACNAWRCPSSTGSWSVISPRSRRPRSGTTGRRSPPASCRPPTSAPRCSSCRPRRTPRRTAPSPTPSGSCSGTTRRSTRRGTARSELWFTYHLGRIIREKLATSNDARDAPIRHLAWDYPTEGAIAEPSADAVLAEINGWDHDGPAARPATPRSRTTAPRRVAAGSTAAVAPTASTSAPTQAGRRPDVGCSRVGMGVAGQPANAVQPGVGRSGRPAMVRAEALRLVGRGGQALDR